MRIKTLLNILGALIAILGITMVVPIFISFGYGEMDRDLNGFIFSSLICIGIGLPVWFSDESGWFCDCNFFMGHHCCSGQPALLFIRRDSKYYRCIF